MQFDYPRLQPPTIRKIQKQHLRPGYLASKIIYQLSK